MGAVIDWIGNLLSSLFRAEIVMEYGTRPFGGIYEGGDTLMWLIVIILALIMFFTGGDWISGLIGAGLGWLGYVVLCGLWWLLINWVFPFTTNTVVFIAGIALIASVLCGTIVALVNYVRSFIANANPYESRDFTGDSSSPRAQKNAKRLSYFFGPGFYSMKETMIGVWPHNLEIVLDFKDDIDMHGIIGWVLGIIPFVFFTVSVFVVGSAATIFFSLLHIAVMFPVMGIIYLLFTVSWAVDRIYLVSRSITSNCPVCQTRVVIPTFYCSCGRDHTRLVPGVYGIWSRECVCGEKLPTMFLLGRSKLQSACPNCNAALTSSASAQFAVSVVGGTSCGKSVWLAAFWHEFFRRIKGNEKYVNYKIPEMSKERFERMEKLFAGNSSGNTDNEMNSAIMQSVILESGSFKASRQFSLYDISGESFRNSDLRNILPQKQFDDSNGIVFLVDPLYSDKLRKEAEDGGEDILGASPQDPNEVLNNFVTYYTTVLTAHGITHRIQKPLAVLMVKSDMKCVKKRLSRTEIKKIQDSAPDQFVTEADARDEACRNFLLEIGMHELVNNIATRFTNVRYFPVSAIGHTENGHSYVPERVLEPIDWIIEQTDPEVRDLFRKIGDMKNEP